MEANAARVTARTASAPATPAQRVARTDSQAARGSGAVVLLLWAAGFVGVDLDPTGPGTDLPVEVAVILAGLLTAAAARWMNRGAEPPPPPGPPVLIVGGPPPSLVPTDGPQPAAPTVDLLEEEPT